MLWAAMSCVCRKVCKGLGVDVTCGEMALATNLLQGQGSEWALLKRDPCEDLFGVQARHVTCCHGQGQMRYDLPWPPVQVQPSRGSVAAWHAFCPQPVSHVHVQTPCRGPVQVCGGFPDAMTRCAQMLEEQVDVDFVDVNCGCPIDLICSKCALRPLLETPHPLGPLCRASPRTGRTGIVGARHACRPAAVERSDASQSDAASSPLRDCCPPVSMSGRARA